MLDSLFTTSTGSEAVLGSGIMAIVAGLVTGLVISWLYIRTNRHSYSQSLAWTLVFMPAVIGPVIALVGSNIAAAFSLAGIFTIIRFRSAPGSARDILLILFSVGAGLAYGLGLYLYGAIFAILMVAAQLVLYATNYGQGKNSQLQLRIVAPESSNNEETFASVLEKHTASFALNRIGTRDLGSVYELVYDIELPKDGERKTLIDDLRRHNSNMNITISNRASASMF
ncbi:MAG TPA: DUF4956 domain-containing protein [Candidatus Saccharibacteria bacterium]|nr:DUF4956 domain-containing protein [Candidatus Saccharibacteria bacterium]